jgi:hypothetical protein
VQATVLNPVTQGLNAKAVNGKEAAAVRQVQAHRKRSLYRAWR